MRRLSFLVDTFLVDTFLAGALLASAACASSAHAQGFSVLVSPPRFEDSATAGATYRNVFEITNVAGSAAHFTVKTADWVLDDKGAAVFADALAPDSCRPWVGIEAAEVAVPANGKRRFRFEVAVPAGAPSGECRFALMLEGDPTVVPNSSAPPVSGRIGVIVYLSIGDATPQLSVSSVAAVMIEGRRVPVLQVRNNGNAHGRLNGFVDGVDAAGRKFVFAPSGLPVLAGETRAIALMPQGDDADTPAPAIAFPVRLQGRLEVGNERVAIDAVVKQ
jgi:hypothetical protein